MSTPLPSADDNSDMSADRDIAECLSASPPRSFFLFAGAGSGKTRSLVAALEHIQRQLGEDLRSRGARVAVITYTNAASDEIQRRLRFDPLIDVRTIHSFAWSLIEGLNRDIREWLRVKLVEDIRELKADEAKGRKGTKASATRLSRIESKTRRLSNLDNIKLFVYSPTGDNRGRDSLNHAEVLQLTAHFLTSKPSMRSILAGRFPIVLIDESQDTNAQLIDAFFAVESALKSRFMLGLFGDMMQRIYFDGKDGLGEQLPSDWATPRKLLNHRSPKRVVTLINRIRSSYDRQQQKPRSDSVEGHVRFFLLPHDVADKSAAECAVAERMAKITEDAHWSEPSSCKKLILEHRMAATRMGFLDVFGPLYDVDCWRTSFLEGTLPPSRFFARDVLPLVKAQLAADRFGVARILKALSPLLSPESLRLAKDTRNQLKTVSDALNELMALWNNGADPTLLQVLRCIGRTGLLDMPEILLPNASSPRSVGYGDSAVDAEESEAQTERRVSIEKFLQAPFSQIEPFDTYMSRKAPFDTHQGVKGLEFDRVMVIMDDTEAKGFSFKYEDLFGGRPSGDKIVAATRRLFYVTCSRARKSLALTAYAKNPNRVREFVMEEGWFESDEIVLESAL